jgi:polyisoprenyl-teichoic acid--peptidoglycan teichoic acid transferase
MEPSVLSTAAYRETAQFSLKGAAPMNLNWKTILKKAGIILLSTLLFALCSGLLYITKMAGSINITRPEDEPELASAMTNENLDTETREKLGGYWTIAVFGVDSRNGKLGKENNADVQMLCSINRDTGEIRLVSLYRDTFLMNDTANSGYGKLNQSYFLRGPSLSPEQNYLRGLERY